MAVGSIAGGLVGARWVATAGGRVWVFKILVVVLAAELGHLVLHYVFRTT